LVSRQQECLFDVRGLGLCCILPQPPVDGIAIDVRGQTEQALLVKNEIRETSAPMSRIGIRIGANAKDVVLTDNCIKGFAREVADLRTTST
jgi:hypothetical protein